MTDNERKRHDDDLARINAIDLDNLNTFAYFVRVWTCSPRFCDEANEFRKASAMLLHEMGYFMDGERDEIVEVNK